jgi:serine/threonine protein kinase HipA of HipAB toxin-antitoxin module
MTMNGKRDGFEVEDFRECARSALMRHGRAETILAEVGAAVRRWPEFAAQAGVAEVWREQIQRSFRLELAGLSAGEAEPPPPPVVTKGRADFVVVANQID